MARLEFSRSTRREALKRSGMKCEATGPRYGYEDGHRCNAPLGNGVEFDHTVPAELGGDNSIGNCTAACIRCHRFATANDIREIRKSDRMRDKASKAFKPSVRPIPGSRASGIRKRMSGRVERW